MRYLAGMAEAKKDVRVQLLISQDEIEAVDEWRWGERIDGRSEAIRQLLKAGLEAMAQSKASKPPVHRKR